MSQLAADVGFSPSRLSHTVGRMEEAGWIVRSPSSADRRGTDAKLTELGAKVVEDASLEHLALVKRLIFDAVGLDRASAAAEVIGEIGRAADARD